MEKDLQMHEKDASSETSFVYHRSRPEKSLCVQQANAKPKETSRSYTSTERLQIKPKIRKGVELRT